MTKIQPPIWEGRELAFWYVL